MAKTGTWVYRNGRLVEKSRFVMAYLTAGEIEERRRRFWILEERGLVARIQQDDGTALLTFPLGRDHPEIVDFEAGLTLQ